MGEIVVDPVNVDEEAIMKLFSTLDVDGKGAIDAKQFRAGLRSLGALPTLPDQKKERRDAEKLERERS